MLSLGVEIDYSKKTVYACAGDLTSYATRLSSHLKWIEQHIQMNYCEVNNI